MLDHVFTDAIGALRDVLEGALLERLAIEERFHVDVLLGDTSWETSYGIPGEGMPAKVRADITLDWPTWSQTAYRSWYVDDEFGEAPQITIAVVFRLQRLAHSPDPGLFLRALPSTGPRVGRDALRRAAPMVETIYDNTLAIRGYAIEATYEGNYEFDEAALRDGSALDDHFSSLGGWISSVLVALSDLPMSFHPPTQPPAS